MYNLDADKDRYFQLGRFIKTHGFNGEVVLAMDTDKPGSYDGLEVIFVDIERSLVPWFINAVEIRGELAILGIDDVDDQEKAREFVGRSVYLPVEDLQELDDNNFYFHEIIGFTAIDKKHGHLGIVDRILERPKQEVISIRNGDKEIMVPLTESMILGIDRENHEILLDTPDGLVELYL